LKKKRIVKLIDRRREGERRNLFSFPVRRVVGDERYENLLVEKKVQKS
jgi:hypothetical protein